jgi:predicted Co/Zn/Cd cation transporter (cation efflux family)
MHLDLRYPIGLLLTLYGVILAIQGLTAGARVLDLNVNLHWGAVMTAGGLATLYLARRRA